MTAVHLLPLEPSKTSLVVQITAAVMLAISLFFVREIALRVSSGSGLIALGAVAMTASYLPLNHWSLQGMEVSVLVLSSASRCRRHSGRLKTAASGRHRTCCSERARSFGPTWLCRSRA